MKCAKAESLKRPRPQSSLTLFPSTLFTSLILLSFLMVGTMLAQNESVSVQVGAEDRAAGTYATSNFRYRILPARTLAGSAARSARTTGLSPRTSASSSSSGGFYPADLTRGTGPLIKKAIFHDIDFDCAESCWGKPSAFLNDLGNSTFIHLVDRYVGATGNGRYTVGTNVSASAPLFTNTLGQNDVLAIVHAAAAKLGKTGYGHIYHLFLPNGVDTCFDQTNICYSPDNPSSFAFCAYHGSVTYSDIGHVLLTVEPFQNVDGCSVATPSPNGALVDSTANVLSHETFETITDPDPPATFDDLFNGNFGWLALNSLVEFGEEIADICEDPFFGYNPVTLNGKSYEIQPEYSNKFHTCAFVP